MLTGRVFLFFVVLLCFYKSNSLENPSIGMSKQRVTSQDEFPFLHFECFLDCLLSVLLDHLIPNITKDWHRLLL